MAIVVVIGLLGAGAVAVVGPPAPAPSPESVAREARVVIPIYNDRGLRAVRDDLRSHLRRGDTFLIVSGNQDAPIDTVWVDAVAEQVRTFYPGTTILAATSGLANVQTAVAELEPPVEGVAYIYEPEFANEPEFTWDFATTVGLFESVADQAREVGLLAIGKPTGRPLLAPALSEYAWDYAALSASVDDLYVQTQQYCEDSPESFDEAIATLMTQFGGDAEMDRWVPQVTLDISSRHGVDVTRALACVAAARERGVDRFLMWWSPAFPNHAAAFLEALRP